LLLGEKWDGGLYAQEEIEIARVTCERLLDTQASAQLSRRLMALQREQLLQNQMVDLRARRVIHDEVLPNLQAALIEVDGSQAGGEAASLLSDSHRLLSDLLGEIPTVTAAELARLGLIPVLRQTVASEFAGSFDEVIWQIDASAEEQVTRLPAVTAETLYYATREAVRNAARHGRDEGQRDPYCLRIGLRRQEALQITVEDNGKGVNISGLDKAIGGQGLALYGTMMAVVGGSLTVDSMPGHFTIVRLSLPQPAAGDEPDSK
jgi:signal transduction histidine kinase